MPTPTDRHRPLADPDTAWVLEEAIEVLAIIRDQWHPEAGIDPADRLALLHSLILQAHRHLLPAIEDAQTHGYSREEIRGMLNP